MQERNTKTPLNFNLSKKLFKLVVQQTDLEYFLNNVFNIFEIFSDPVNILLAWVLGPLFFFLQEGWLVYWSKQIRKKQLRSWYSYKKHRQNT